MAVHTDIAIGLVLYGGLMLAVSLFWMRRVMADCVRSIDRAASLIEP